MIVTNHIRETRLAAEMSQQRLAELAGISISYVKRLEDGESAPTVPVARSVASALGATVDDLWPLLPAVNE